MSPVSLTSGGIDIHFEPPIRGDCAINMVIVQILDMVTRGIVKTQLLKGHRDLKRDRLYL